MDQEIAQLTELDLKLISVKALEDLLDSFFEPEKFFELVDSYNPY